MPAVDEYIQHVESDKREWLERIRSLVRQAVPGAEESISYGIPAFKYKKKPLMYYAAFKDHLSVFPTSKPAEALRGKLEGFAVTKGTIKFTLDHPLPDSIIKELVELRVQDIDKNEGE